MGSDVERHLPLNPRDYLILLTLADGELHGYGMMKAVADQTDGEVSLDPANLYRSLKRMIREGLLAETSQRSAPDARGERRRYYGITRLGRNVLKADALRIDRLAELARSHKLIPPRRRTS